jgi:hypothetical protein
VFKLIALAKSFGGTSAGIIDCRAGPSNVFAAEFSAVSR